ncbi:MAG: plasmid mobilization protein [Christensenellales bacterium]|jgi:electron transfer flavoprotein alpha/beta subunit
MSLKVYDGQGRWRNKTVAFRVSPEEDERIETAVRLSGLTKQDYIVRRLQCLDVVVQGNPRVYKALRNELAAVLTELQRIDSGEQVNDDLLDTIQLITTTMDGLKEEC